MKSWLSGNSTALRICLLQNSIFCLFAWQMLPCAKEYCLIKWAYISQPWRMEENCQFQKLKDWERERERLHDITFYDAEWDAGNVISLMWFTYKQCKSNLADYILRQKTESTYLEVMPEPWKNPGISCVWENKRKSLRLCLLMSKIKTMTASETFLMNL